MIEISIFIYLFINNNNNNNKNNNNNNIDIYYYNQFYRITLIYEYYVKYIFNINQTALWAY